MGHLLWVILGMITRLQESGCFLGFSCHTFVTAEGDSILLPTSFLNIVLQEFNREGLNLTAGTHLQGRKSSCRQARQLGFFTRPGSPYLVDSSSMLLGCFVGRFVWECLFPGQFQNSCNLGSTLAPNCNQKRHWYRTQNAETEQIGFIQTKEKARYMVFRQTLFTLEIFQNVQAKLTTSEHKKRRHWKLF